MDGFVSWITHMALLCSTSKLSGTFQGLTDGLDRAIYVPVVCEGLRAAVRPALDQGAYGRGTPAGLR